MLRKVCAVAFALAVASVGSAQNFANNATIINAGVIVLQNDVRSGVAAWTPFPAAPFAFYNLNAATNIMPAGWSIQNPLAPGQVTPAVASMWSTIRSETGGNFLIPNAGDVVSKRDAAYWEVSLNNVTDAQLSQFNLLLVAPSQFLSMTSLEREELRRFVDGGGILWIDTGALAPGAASVDQINPGPVAISLANTGGAVPASDINADLTQPILTSPYPLTVSDISLLDSFKTTYLTGTTIGLPIEGSGPGDIITLEPYANNGDLYPTEMLTRLGDGFVVVTARGAALELNRPTQVASYFTNTAYYAVDNGSAPILGPDGIVAGKLVVNMISLQNEARMAQSGSRKANSLGLDVNPPLMQRFNFENAGMTPPAAVAGSFPTAMPVFYKNLMLVTAGNVLYAYDVFPPENLDGTGNPDDGIVDYSIGTPYDLVWEAQIGNAGSTVLSSPACTEVANGPIVSGVPRDQVWVSDNQGNLYMYNAFPMNANGIGFNPMNLIDEPWFSRIGAPGGVATYSAGELPIAPTIHDGYVFAADVQSSGIAGTANNGRIWIADTRTATTPLYTQTTGEPWVIGGTAAGPIGGASIGDISGSPIVGEIPIADNSGGSDEVIYVPVRSYSNGPISTPAGIVSIWLGAKGESPVTPPSIVGDTLQIQTRAGQYQGLATWTDPNSDPGLGGAPDPRTLKLTVIQGGQPWNAQEMAQYFQGTVGDNGAGTLTFQMNTGKGAAFQTLMQNSAVAVRIDYTIDWGKSGVTTNLTNKIVRGEMTLLDASPSVRQIVGNIALSPRGTLYAVVADPAMIEPGGTFYEIREQGYGAFNYVVRYDLYPQHNITLNQALPTEYDEVLYDKDPINQFVNTADWVTQRSLRQLNNFIFTGGPTIRNGEVFVSAQATKTLVLPNGPTIPNVPVTILMAFAAEPLSPEIPVGTWPSGSSLVQPDFARSNPATLTNPSVYGMLSNTGGYSGFNYDPDSGYLQFNNLADQSGGKIQNCLSLSQPVILRRPGNPDVLIDPSSLTGRWSPLLWYQVFQGAGSSYGSGPVVTGDSVFLAMNSAVPGILTNPNETSLQVQGLVNATTAQIPTNSPWLQAADWQDGVNGDYRPWQLQLWTLPSPFASSSAFNGEAAPGTGVDPYLVWPQLSGVGSLQDYVTRLNQTTMNNSTLAYGIAAGDGALAAVGNLAIYTFDRAQFLVCDEGRLARFDSSGNPIQVMQNYISGGLNDASNAGVLKPLVRPTRAYDIDENTSLVVDTGANRIIKVDKSGNELRSIANFQFDPNYTNPTGSALYTNIWPQEGGFGNESLNLKAPADVLTFGGYTALTGGQATQQVTDQQPIEYWTHYLIADKGNNRLLELVDRFSVDPTTLNVGPPIFITEYAVKDDGTFIQQNIPQLGVCLWHSPQAQSGRGYAYNSVNRVWIPSKGTFPGRYVYVAGVGNASTAFDQNITQSTVFNKPPLVPNGSPGSSGQGGIVIFDSSAPNFAQVYNSMYGFQNMTNTPFWDFAQNTWDDVTPLNVTNLVAAAPVGSTDFVDYGVRMPFNNVNSVTCKVYAPTTAIPGQSPVIWIMVADSDGVYEVRYTPDGEQPQAAPGALPINWYMPDQVYRSLRNSGTATNSLLAGNPNALNATFAKRLDNGDVLIVNGYSGTFYPQNIGAFNGEVLEVNGQTGGSGQNGTPSGNGYNLNVPNLGFGLASIHYVLGPIQKVRGLLLPSFADRR